MHPAPLVVHVDIIVAQAVSVVKLADKSSQVKSLHALLNQPQAFVPVVTGVLTQIL